ncbi:hypothetical protein Cni_G09892 [Canna indica]|uniref:Uncharacterized protein n=1 Tax=Canna indica TaxID=4628 RepID=A0AAQ3K5Q4_9LILI|nr:hypothetical protein Cni_G09892 [Canna indica]
MPRRMVSFLMLRGVCLSNRALGRGGDLGPLPLSRSCRLRSLVLLSFFLDLLSSIAALSVTRLQSIIVVGLLPLGCGGGRLAPGSNHYGGGVAIADLEEIVARMNHCAIQQNAFGAREEMRAPFPVADRRAPLFCPKPRRLSPLAVVPEPICPLRWPSSHQADFCDSKAGEDLLDIFLAKGGELYQVPSSPPFFCGSPPSRAANPVVHDARFGEDRPHAPVAPLPLTQSLTPMSPNQGCAHAKFGLLPAAVRVEGFACLSRDRRSCSSITAVA